ncbi:MAG: AIR synthase family protein [Candidatus Promineifilaceae bacterium]
MRASSLPLGKLPASLLDQLLHANPVDDSQLLVGPGIGIDCAVLEFDSKLLVLKSDPITFTTDEVGSYLVLVNANDIAVMGARPRWLLITLLLPEGRTTEETVEALFQQISAAANACGVSVIGGHTEITYGIDRLLAIGTMIGEVEKSKLVVPTGAQPDHRILMTKGLGIEATAIAGREFADRLRSQLTEGEIQEAADYLFDPGISVLRDVQLAVAAGQVSAMHDPTEGGVASALWELAEACGYSLVVQRDSMLISALTEKICRVLGIEPLASISSGSLLLTAPKSESGSIIRALTDAGIPCAEIGWVEEGPPQVYLKRRSDQTILPWPEQDEIAHIYQS